MAVYKSIYCYPFSENADISCVLPYFRYDPNTQSVVEGGGEPFYFSCRVDSSNKNVIGYSIKIYDDTGKVVFPLEEGEPKVSPIAQLPKFTDDPTINTGVNGTYLKIPFFQLYDNLGPEEDRPGSYNALYLRKGNVYADIPRYFVADAIIGATVPSENTGESILFTGWDHFSNWSYDENSHVLSPVDDTEIIEEFGPWDGKINGITLTKSTVVLCYYQSEYASDPVDLWGLFRINDSGDGLILFKELFDPSHSPIYLQYSPYIRCGRYGGFYSVSNQSPEAGAPSGCWFNVLAHVSSNFLMDGSSYSWEITLYQGPDTKSVNGLLTWDDYPSAFYSKFREIYRINPTKIPGDWYDMNLGTGNILGSDGKRLQLSDLWETRLPGEGLESPVVLTNKYARLGTLSYRGYPYYGWMVVHPELGSLSVSSFDSSLGYVYLSDYIKKPMEFLRSVSSVSYQPALNCCCFYKYSTNANEIYERDIVKTSFDSNVNFEEKSTTLNVGDRVLLRGQTDALQNGVYVYNSAIPYYARAADFSTWGEYIGRVIFVRDSKQNYSNSASPGGTLDATPLYFYEQKPLELFPKSSFESKDIADVIIQETSEMPSSPIGKQTELQDGYYIYGEYKKQRTGSTQWHINELFLIVKVEAGFFVAIEAEFAEELRQGKAYYHLPENITSQLMGMLYSKGLQDFCFPTEIINLSFDTYIDMDVQYDICSKITYLYAHPFLGNCYAKILYNDTTRTFVQPNNYLATNIKVRLLGGARTKLQDTSAVVSALDVLEANQKFWYFTHERLSSENNFQWILYPCGSDGDSSYRYSLISCYTVGNENPFTDYCSPYLYLDGERTESNEIEVPSLYFMANAHYTQGQNASWESYRFTLKDENGNIIQDTGEKYNKDTRVLLLGLDADSSYTLNFTVVDDIGYRTTLENILVTPESEELTDYKEGYSGLSFKASFDCFTHSVLLEYIGNPEFESGHISVYRREIGEFKQSECDGNYNLSTWYGEWHPVVIDEEITQIIVDGNVVDGARFRDFDISNDRAYQYAVFPKARSRDKFFAAPQNIRNWNNNIMFYPGEKCIYKNICYRCLRNEDTEAFKGDYSAVSSYDEGDIVYYRGFYYKCKNAFRYRGDYDSNSEYEVGDIVLATPSFVLPRFKCTTPTTGDFNYNDWSPVFDFQKSDWDLLDYQSPEESNDWELYGEFSIRAHWDEWSIVELIPEDPRILVGKDLITGGDLVEVPIVKRKYKASPLNMWLLKMDMDAGSQEQNITRSESQTLGQYDRVGYSKRNFDSGSISCYLGSEIVPLSKTGYTERLREAYTERYSKPRTSNQSAQMLEAWRKFAQSPNPKLLTDRRGRKWIVQITSSNVTPQEPYIGVPAKISFSWKEIEDDYAVTISGSGEELASPGSKPEWRPIIF